MAKIICELCGNEGPDLTEEDQEWMTALADIMSKDGGVIGLAICPNCIARDVEIEQLADAKRLRRN